MNIEKFKLIEKVKLSYLKHRGNVLEVSKELKLPFDFIKKAVNKFRKQEERSVRILISNTIARHILLGYESRIRNYMDILKKLENRDQLVVSVCCNYPVIVEARNNERVDVCMKCNKPCLTHIVDKVSIYRMKKEILEQLREEDRLLIEFAEKMGYTNKEEKTPESVIYNTQNIAVIRNDKEGKLNKEVVEEVEKLSPHDRELLIKKLENKIAEKSE